MRAPLPPSARHRATPPGPSRPPWTGPARGPPPHAPRPTRAPTHAGTGSGQARPDRAHLTQGSRPRARALSPSASRKERPSHPSRARQAPSRPRPPGRPQGGPLAPSAATAPAHRPRLRWRTSLPPGPGSDARSDGGQREADMVGGGAFAPASAGDLSNFLWRLNVGKGYPGLCRPQRVR